MPDTYTHDDFSRSIVPKGFAKDVVDTIEGAVMMGWKLMITGTGSMTLVSHDGYKKLHFSTRRNSGPIDRMRRTIIKHAEPGRKAMSQKIIDGDVDADIGVQMLDMIHPPVTMARPEDEPAPEPKPTPKTVRHIVSQGPMLAKAGENTAYSSKTTIERHWSDGSVDYKCARCDYTSTNRKSASAHWPKHVKDDEKARAGNEPRFRASVPNATVYAPRQARIDALAAFLIEALGHGKINMDDPEAVRTVAKEALTWQHQQSKKGTDLSAEREELEDGDILNRIRTLLDQGQYAQQQAQIDQLRSENETLAFNLEEQREKTQRVEETLRTFKELVAEIGDES